MKIQARPRSLRFALIALFLAGGLIVWGELLPMDAYVGFRIPPKVRTESGASLPRAALRAMTVIVRDREGVLVARAQQDLTGGLESPVTAPISMRLPRGEYLVLATLSLRGGATASLVGTLELADDGYHSVDLKRPE